MALLTGIPDVARWLAENGIASRARAADQLVIESPVAGCADGELILTWRAADGYVQLSQTVAAIPDDCDDALAAAVGRLNATLAFPGLVLDERRDEVCYRVAVPAEDTVPEPVLRRLLAICVRTAAKLAEELAALVAPAVGTARSAMLAADVMEYMV